MAGFDDLPNEIILDTLEVVLPEDLENFAQTSKRVFLLAKPLLEHHRQLIRLHSTFKSKQVRRDGFRFAPIPALLMKMRNEPHIGRYIREAKLKSLLRTYSGPIRSNDSNKDREFYGKQRNLVNAVIAQSNVPNIRSFYHPNERLYSKSSESYEEFLVVLFLLLLPNLNSLSLSWNPAQDYFRDMIRQSALDGNCWLANLTTIRVKGFLSKDLGVRDLSLFSSLPALKSLMALNSWDPGLTEDDSSPPPDSHTKQLELRNCHFAKGPLCWYLESFRSLQTFTLAFVNCDPGNFDPDMIRAALVTHAKTTLQSLTITAISHYYSGTFMGSLQQFEALRELRTEWRLLFPRPCRDETWLSRVLPASIRKIQLDDNSGYRSSEFYRALCQGLQCAKEKTCLHLDLVEIGRNLDYWDEIGMTEFLDQLQGFCREIGMSVAFRKKARTSEWQAGSNVLSLTFTEKV